MVICKFFDATICLCELGEDGYLNLLESLQSILIECDGANEGSCPSHHNRHKMIASSPTIGSVFIRSATTLGVNFGYIYCILCVYLNTRASHELRTSNTETTD